ncbi:MAG TPA: tetratricopeptide repeat protein [Gemmatimonadaceae bacterium]|nr:tetratricopeptide repeat protein [Gemmatimonadaceae bacterium]
MKSLQSYGVILILAIMAVPVVALPAQQGGARLAADARDPAVARDSAIRQLQGFIREYPDSPLRPRALLQLGELLVQRADELFYAEQRGATPLDTTAAARSSAARPDYGEAIAHYEELVRRYPDFERISEAAYTLGALYALEQRHADAARTFRIVTEHEDSPQRAEAFFRLGDAEFEIAAQAVGAERRRRFAAAAQAYEQATQLAPADGDIYLLSLYKLGWSYYNQATATNQEEYRLAVQVFDRLIEAYDRLTAEQQARLGLRDEAIEYMAISFTQIGGAEAASSYFETRGGAPYRVQVLRRVATSLRDQGNFPQAVTGYRTLLAEAPTDTGALAIQLEVIDIYQNRMLVPDSAQIARLELVDRFAPGSAWAQANAARLAEAREARETALREAGQYELAAAQRTNAPARFGEAAQLYQRFVNEFPQSDSIRPVTVYLGEALFGQRDFGRAGAQYSRAAYGFPERDSLARQAGQNAIVAFDSALARARGDRSAQDSLFGAVDRFVEAFPQTEVARVALRQKGQRASEVERWDAMAAAYRQYAQRYPDDAYTPTAQRLVADALYRQGQYAEAQVQWDEAQRIALTRGQRALADSIAATRTTAAASFADTLIQRGEYRRAAEEVYVAIADRNPEGAQAPDALRDAIETYRMADSAAQRANDAAASRQAKQRAAELAERLVARYPNYRYRTNYQLLRANLLADLGRREEAVDALRQLTEQNRQFEGRADAMVRTALLLDSLGRTRDAAEAYAAFSTAYPNDSRAADAQFNAAVSFVEAGDSTAAAQAYGRFAQRFPRDPRAGEARGAQIAMLRGAGDIQAAESQLAQLCQRPTPETRELCAERNARRYFDAGVALWPQYDALELRVTGAVTRAAVDRASAQKRQLLQRMVGQFEQAINTGHPEYLSAATYYVGLAQWEYGNFLRDVQLPGTLGEQDRQAAQEGARQQAEEFYTQARNTWQALIETAQQENIRNQWVDRARAAIRGDVQIPPPGGTDDSASAGGSE